MGEKMTDLGEKMKELITKGVEEAIEKAMDAMRQSLADWVMESQTMAKKKMGKNYAGPSKLAAENDEGGREIEVGGERTQAKETYSDGSKLLLEMPALQVFDENSERIFVQKALTSISQGINPIICSPNPYWNALKIHCNMVMVYKLHENEYGKLDSKLENANSLRFLFESMLLIDITHTVMESNGNRRGGGSFVSISPSQTPKSSEKAMRDLRSELGSFGVSLGNGKAVKGNGVCQGVLLQLEGGVEIVDDFLPLELGNSIGSDSYADMYFKSGVQYHFDMPAKHATVAESKVPSESVNVGPAPLLDFSNGDSVNGQKLGVEAKAKPFKFLVKLPRFDDDKLQQQIKDAHLLVDEKTLRRDDIRSEIEMKRAKLQSINNKYEQQIRCIAAVVHSINGHRVIPIYEADIYGGDPGLYAVLTEALQRFGVDIEYPLVLPSFFFLSDENKFIQEEVAKLLSTPYRVFIVLHASVSMAIGLFKEAKQMGLVGEDSIWIMTGGITSLLDSFDTSVIPSMEGALGINVHF